MTATHNRKDTEVFWCHLLFQKLKILSTFWSKIAMDNRFLCKICLPFFSPEDFSSKTKLLHSALFEATLVLCYQKRDGKTVQQASAA